MLKIRSRHSFAVAVFALLVGVGIAFWLHRRGEPSLILADGRKVAIVDVTFGTAHRVRLGPAWAHALSPVLPSGLAARLGVKIFQHTTERPALVVWTEWSGIQRIAAPTDASIAGAEQAQTEPRRFVTQTHMADKTAFMAWVFVDFPRRQRTVDLVFHDRGNDYQPHEVGRMPVANPAFKKYPDWPVPARPWIGSNDECTFTLSSWHQMKNGPPSLSPNRVETNQWVAGTFSVLCDGLPAACEVIEVRIADATGNAQWFKPYPPAEGLAGSGTFAIRPTLWLDDDAWQLQVRFIRSTGFRQEEIFTIEDITVPGPGQVTPIEREVVVKGVTATIWSLRRPERAAISPDPAVRNRAELLTQVPGDASHTITIVRAEAADGRLLGHQKMTDAYPRQLKFGVEMPTSTNRVRITVALQRIQEVTLVVGPPDKPPTSG